MSEQSEAPRDRPHNSYPYDTGLVRELLKRKRKVRGIKSCFPCRHRKVKCDGESPCESCVRRGHEELCRFPGEGGDLPVEIESAPAKRIAKGHTSNEDLINRLTAIESQISSLKADLLKSTVSSPSAQAATEPEETSRTRRSGSHYVEDATGATIYLGSHSDSPLVLGCRRQASLPLSSASPDMMLHNVMMDQVVPRAYPFTSLWGPDVDIAEVCKTLPGDEDVIRYWQIYQSTTHPFYPALVTIDQFNMSLFDFLDRRAEGQNDAHPSWLALLFAVLACGVQFSDDAVQERDLRSKVFVCSSFQCLRMSNFFNQADLDEVQTMALIGNYSRNNLDTNSSWILMGTTMRLAQSIGLHEAEDPVQKQLWYIRTIR
ncbi:hypothetical protein MW887_004410 [Aspergillus wentii]|nr:hypothetical protein MW887_004410 [Aspergillus wentii]